jgi:hypothetical protein
MSEKARVFISCGQRESADYLKIVDSENLQLFKYPELVIAKQIASKLEKMGFETYIAREQQTLQGVKDAIFKNLEKSEYFLFVDFRRERLYDEGDYDILSKNYRGSLFSNQELAIATFQGYDVIAFQEAGVKKTEGILRFIQVECKTFSDRKSLPSFVAKQVKKRKWSATWRNEVCLDRDKTDYEDATAPQGGAGRYYHIKVLNKHKDKIARNCFAYVESIKDIATGRIRFLELVEFKWKGVVKETVSIVPKAFRCLDALHINVSNPTVAYLGLNPFIVDWTELFKVYQISGIGDYEIGYVVFSEDFAPARAKFKLHIDPQIQNTTLERI